MATCSDNPSCAMPRNATFLIAPCGTIEFGDDGKPSNLTDALLAALYRLAWCESFSYTPTLEETVRQKGGVCGASTCSRQATQFNVTTTVEKDDDDDFISSLSHLYKTCEFDTIYIPCPKNCLKLSAENDIMHIQRFKFGVSDHVHNIDDNACQTLPVSGTSCGQEICSVNDNEAPLLETLQTLKTAATQQQLNTGKEQKKAA